MEIKRVLLRTDGIKYCIIPKKSVLKPGELVLITNDPELISKKLEEENGNNREQR